MEKIAQYKAIAKEVLSTITDRKNRSRRPATYQLIADEAAGTWSFSPPPAVAGSSLARIKTPN
ncbi:MAG: hypothetical protein EPO28_03740 [Saprospiraceae bacterium]|nr:MAG: hypothetical protein EPO28_03740 [Saprospiraceae bacterium]